MGWEKSKFLCQKSPSLKKRRLKKAQKWLPETEKTGDLIVSNREQNKLKMFQGFKSTKE